MPYDFENDSDKAPPATNIVPAQGDDLEVIVTLLELAAIGLSPLPDSTFSLADLLREARELGGEEVGLRDDDAQAVLIGCRFLKKVPGGRWSIK